MTPTKGATTFEIRTARFGGELKALGMGSSAKVRSRRKAPGYSPERRSLIIWNMAVSEAPASITGQNAANDDVEASPRAQRQGGYQLLSADPVRLAHGSMVGYL